MNARRVLSYAALALFLLAAWSLHRELAHFSLDAILTRLHETPASRVLAAAACAVASYVVLIGYDVLALRYVRKPVPFARTALTSFMAFAVGNNVGIATLSAGPIRYRMYSVNGLSGAEIGKVILFCTVTFAVGTATLVGSALWLASDGELLAFGLSITTAKVTGTVLLAGSLSYVAWPLVRHLPFRIADWQIEVPRIGVTLGQLLVSATDLVLSAATLYVLAGPDLGVGFVAFLGAYLVAICAALLSGVPGGLGVFEAIIFLAFPDVDRDVLLGKMIAYRLIYYIAPLVLALAIMAMHEARAHRGSLQAVGGRLAGSLSTIAPQLMGTAVFLAGMVLLVSGASPGIESRLQMIGSVLPHALLELSHLAGSVIGFCLLVLARGLYRRLHGAYRMAGILLLGGAVASLLKGFDYEEAAILLLGFLLLRATRGEFHRQGALFDQRLSPSWIAVWLIAIAGTAWVALASYRHVPYAHELWWQFSLDGDAPRTLRAMLLVTIAAIGFLLARLMAPASPRPDKAPAVALDLVAAIVASAARSAACAALIGDKRILFNDARTAFIMYQVNGRSWVALGDPVGPPAEHEALAWRFRELCDRYDGWPVFYEVSDAALPLYIDLGLTLSKLGEEGLVPLDHFTLEGKERADFRQARNRAQRAGATFEVVPQEQVPGLIPELRAISDNWLAQKGAAEKGFSLGRFDAEYLSRFACALVRVGGTPVAFANLWQAPAGGEFSIDLMRYDEGAPKGVMDYLFAELMLWGRDRGFHWFDLGMAPLSGLEDHPLAPVWHRVGGLIYRHTEDFYNFEGLRHYKEKFAPVWRPRYLASPGGLVLPRVMLDASILISGGLKKLISR